MGEPGRYINDAQRDAVTYRAVFTKCIVSGKMA